MSALSNPCIAKQCGFWQASALVLVKVDTTQLVLTMFTSPTLPHTYQMYSSFLAAQRGPYD